MGVPSFYKWLVDKYPKIVLNAVEGRENSIDWSCEPNPNGEFHNLYLDMNGIIHPCLHPEDQLFPPTTYDEVFKAIFEYIDRIFRIVRPTNLLFMAIDGVAPRAKMNQQRARRFKAAKDAEIAEEEEERLRKEYELRGIEVLPKQQSEASDPSVIAPGTVFMEKLSKALEYYIRLRINMHPGWKNLKVILSDSNVPGEGEHKIMSFIRLQRGLSGYNPNTKHCFCGLDADLIMLALASHELHFSILREDVLKQNIQEISFSSLESSLSVAERDKIISRPWFKKVMERNGGGSSLKPCQFLKIWILREYLEIEFRIPDSPFNIDIERIVDDFIFMCFFTGNDFLPHIPSIEINECAIDLLMHVYKTEFKSMGGYLVDTTRIKEKKAVYVKAKRLELYMRAVGRYEERTFEKRFKLRQYRLKRFMEERSESLDNFDNLEMSVHSSSELSGRERIMSSSESPQASVSKQHILSSTNINDQVRDKSDMLIKNTREMLQTLKNNLREKEDLFKSGLSEIDKVKLGSPGWEDRYYRTKFNAVRPADVEKMRKEVVREYAKGLCWILQYYYAGVSSWNWFYPFYHAPFVSEIKSDSLSSTSFELGSPFKQFDQLMAILPPRSAHVLPKSYQNLMNCERSPIADFYPTDFEVDMDGKRFIWQAVAKLPFIKEGPLLCETHVLEKELKEEDIKRNTLGFDKIFVSTSCRLGSQILSHYKAWSGVDIAIDCITSGINGFLSLCEDKNYQLQCCFFSTVTGMEDIEDDHVICAIFKNPDSHDHIPTLLAGVEVPEKTITTNDIEERKLWHEYQGSRPPLINTNRWWERRSVPHASSSSSTSSSSAERWKGAGSGWGGCCGRGRGRGNKNREEQHLIGEQNPVVAPSLGRRWYDGSSSRQGSSRTSWSSNNRDRMGREEKNGIGLWAPRSAQENKWSSGCSNKGWGRGRGRGWTVNPNDDRTGRGRRGGW